MTKIRLVSLSNVKIEKPCKKLNEYYKSLYVLKLIDYTYPVIEYSSEAYENMRDYLEMETNNYVFDQPAEYIKNNKSLLYTEDTNDLDLDIDSNELTEIFKFSEIYSKVFELPNPEFEKYFFKQSEQFILTEDIKTVFDKFHNILFKLIYLKNNKNEYYFDINLSKKQQKNIFDFYKFLQNSNNNGIVYIF
jgi:phage anti-repressor protein